MGSRRTPDSPLNLNSEVNFVWIAFPQRGLPAGGYVACGEAGGQCEPSPHKRNVSGGGAPVILEVFPKTRRQQIIFYSHAEFRAGQAK